MGSNLDSGSSRVGSGTSFWGGQIRIQLFSTWICDLTVNQYQSFLGNSEKIVNQERIHDFQRGGVVCFKRLTLPEIIQISNPKKNDYDSLHNLEASKLILFNQIYECVYSLFIQWITHE